MENDTNQSDMPVDEIAAIKESNLVSNQQRGDHGQVEDLALSLPDTHQQAEEDVILPLPYRPYPARGDWMNPSGYKMRGHLYKSQLSMSAPDLSSYIQQKKSLPIRYEQFASSLRVRSVYPPRHPDPNLKLPELSPTSYSPKLMSWGQLSPRTKRTRNIFQNKLQRERSILESPTRCNKQPSTESLPKIENPHLLFGCIHDDKFEERHLWRARYKPDCPCTRCESHRFEWEEKKRRFENKEQRNMAKPPFNMGGIYLQGGTIT